MQLTNMKDTFEEFLSDNCPCHTNNDPAGFENWLEQLDGEQYMEFGQEYGEKMFEKGKNFETNEMLNDLEKKDIIAGVDFKEPLDSLENITGSKLSDMLGKSNEN